MHKTRWLLHDHIRCFAFSLKEFSQLKGQVVPIISENGNPIFRRHYKFSEVERTLVQA
jgi:hypothetical protein